MAFAGKSKPAGRLPVKLTNLLVIEEKILVLTEWEIKILRKPEFRLNKGGNEDDILFVQRVYAEKYGLLL